MAHRLVGVVVEHDGYICLEAVGPGPAKAWYPLGGSSGIAHDFRDAFGEAQRGDIGKRVYCVGEVLQMENEEQRAQRLAQ